MKIKNQLTLLIVLAVLLNACKKSGSGEAPAKKLKYLTQVITSNGTTTAFLNYSYDDQKRLKTIKSGGSTITYTYNGDNVVSIEESYPDGGKQVYELAYADGKLQTMSYKGYKNNIFINETAYGFVYNGDKLTETHQDGHVDYFYYDNNNNLIKQQGEGFAFTYSYDNKKSKFANLPPALKSIGVQIRRPEYFSQNNMISIDRGVNGITNNTYSYDSDGYPTGGATANGNVKFTYVYTEL